MIIVSRVFSRRKRLRAFGLQLARVSRKRPFLESFRVFPRPSIYPFVKAKPVSTLLFKWKSCFQNSLDKALYLPHYRRKLTIWHKPLRRDMKCLQVTLRRTNVRENSLWASCTSSHERTAVRERMICLLYSRLFSLTRKSLLIFTISYRQSFILFWFSLVRLFLMQQ